MSAAPLPPSSLHRLWLIRGSSPARSVASSRTDSLAGATRTSRRPRGGCCSAWHGGGGGRRRPHRASAGGPAERGRLAFGAPALTPRGPSGCRWSPHPRPRWGLTNAPWLKHHFSVPSSPDVSSYPKAQSATGAQASGSPLSHPATAPWWLGDPCRAAPLTALEHGTGTPPHPLQAASHPSRRVQHLALSRCRSPPAEHASPVDPPLCSAPGSARAASPREPKGCPNMGEPGQPGCPRPPRMLAAALEGAGPGGRCRPGSRQGLGDGVWGTWARPGSQQKGSW